ncbi:pyridoxamine 5'-phosphate oxidase family protein [Roseovarius sp. PS-C2]|uniref:pyridoxamine 5'-phosphate oxidase family protein n=1 Tax=Roseovarius sp. PS-C2 TaxID=2820814 RepID=UPI001C0C12AC|nr:pyridoxamine 5'-phosphate oxidase family protein [Roseovarius sp. PS-C2]MBU3260068.1 pyridoxamine 5'-phosphate oxidase family protein [Roseovarius sp. PS-C2]
MTPKVEYIHDIAALEALYGKPGAASLRKVTTHLTPLYRKWIAKSRYCIISTVGPEGTDGSPRGEDGPVVTELDNRTLALPDWRGNNRLDTLRNIVSDGRISLLFMVAGSNTVVRINGQARVTADEQVRAMFNRQGKQPATVIVNKIGEVYTQCARASIRAGIWGRDDSKGLPTVGEMLAETSNGEEGGTEYDAAWMDRAIKTLW